MLVAINSDSVIEYSLVSDTSDNKTVFQIGTLDAFTRAYLDDSHTVIKRESGDYEDTSVHNKYIQIVKHGLRGWKNFNDAQGNAVEFKTEEVNIPRLGKRTVATDQTIKNLDLS
jgi:hypothetical protein